MTRERAQKLNCSYYLKSLAEQLRVESAALGIDKNTCIVLTTFCDSRRLISLVHVTQKNINIGNEMKKKNLYQKNLVPENETAD